MVFQDLNSALANGVFMGIMIYSLFTGFGIEEVD